MTKHMLACHCHSSSALVCGASGFTVTEGLAKASTLDENRFATPVQKEEVVAFLNHPSLKPCLKGLE